MSEQPRTYLQQLFDEACQYEERQDHYNAVKLYKRVLKEAPQWAAPCLRLGHIYKYRQEWKPALYYTKKAASLEAGNQQAWWDIGLAATALKKKRLAWNVWEKFGYQRTAPAQREQVSVRLAYQQQIEIFGVQRNSPCAGHIRSIPHPAADRRYGDLVLIDNTVRGHHYSGNRRLPIFDELGLLKRSTYRTFSCQLLGTSEDDLNLLQHLCWERRLGFELWGHAARAAALSTGGKPQEFHAFPLAGEPELLAAIAAHQAEEALSVLQDWQVISLRSFTGFRAH